MTPSPTKNIFILPSESNNITKKYPNLHKITLAYFYSTPLPIQSLSLSSLPSPTYPDSLPPSQHVIASGSVLLLPGEAVEWKQYKIIFAGREVGDCNVIFPTFWPHWDTTILPYSKCWQSYRAIGTLKHCWWQCKKIKPFWRNNLTISHKVKYILSILSTQQIYLIFSQEKWKRVSLWRLLH